MYFLTILASLSHSTMVPRALRTNLAVRLIMPWRLPWAATFTLPVPVILKRFLAPLLVFSLGILLSFLLVGPYRTFRCWHSAGAAFTSWVTLCALVEPGAETWAVLDLVRLKPPRHAPP